MIRDIQFRAYIKKIGVMLPVDSIHFDIECVGFNIDCNLYEHDFNEVVLMQFTEKLDSFDNPIYEGDVLENKDGECGYIVFEKGCFKLQAITELSKFFMDKEFKIIGNAYENPELLEVE